MSEYVERLVFCGMNLCDALDVYDDFMADGDETGLEAYVYAVEGEYMRLLDDVY